MSKMLTVMWKEIRDNLRDRRSLGFALLFGPLLMPVMFFAPMVFVAANNIQTYETPTDIQVYGADLTPNLVNYLYSENFDIELAPEDFAEQLENGAIPFVLEVSETYAKRFLEGSPARLILHYDKEDAESRTQYFKVRNSLYRYSDIIRSSRMMIRGLDQRLLQPVDIVEHDISEESKAAGNIANMLVFLVVFSMMMGGFYLAVDTTAGERERNSLESLLSLAITRIQVVAGKYLAIVLFVTVSYLLPIISAALWVSYIPESSFGYADVPTVLTFIKIAILTFPLCLLIAGFLMVISAATKSSKEAQTQMSLAMIIPMAPFFAMMLTDIQLDTITGSVPILSQFLIANKIFIDSSFSLISMIPGLVTTLVVSILFFLTSVYLYRKDSMLG